MSSGRRSPIKISAFSWLCLLLPVSLKAQFDCATNNDQVTITRYTGPGGDVIIPNMIGGLPVTGIGDKAFYHSGNGSAPSSLRIPNGVANIGEQAFFGWSGLTNVAIPASVTNIGAAVFQFCTGLESATIPGSVTRIGDWAFHGCTFLTNVMISKGVTSIGGLAFARCDYLSNVTIPSSVTSIEGSAFTDCHNLTSIIVDEANANFTGTDGILFDKSQNTLIKYPGGKSGSLLISASVTRIEPGALNACNKVTIITVDPSNANYSSVGGVLFDKSRGTLIRCPSGKVGDFSIPDGVTNIADGAFSRCCGLTNVMVPNSVTAIGRAAFQVCSNLVSVTIPPGVTRIGDSAFEHCKSLASVTIPASVTSIGTLAFSACSSLTNVTIASTETRIGKNAFAGCIGLTNALFIAYGAGNPYRRALGRLTAPPGTRKPGAPPEGVSQAQAPPTGREIRALPRRQFTPPSNDGSAQR
ncbi:MAG TPA: leucine-rich repeat domain-containing protein [Verrucomicrobiae bacterium]|nr:leucine-rich repeat domain-containing protein [Verrucomicrobiae bacterium]